MHDDSLGGFEHRLGHRFRDAGLLIQALTHRSHSATHNERLEFLGDSVLNCVIAVSLYRRHPGLDEGHLSRLRASLVRQETLCEIAGQMSLSQALRLGEGERKTGGAQRPSMLADAFEAVLGAVYLDAGFEVAAQLIERLFSERMDAIDLQAPGKDAKTRLQEWTQARGVPLPVYALSATEGAAHAQRFEVECRITAPALAVTGTGSSRRAAEQMAAQAAFEQLSVLPEPKAGSRRAPRTGSK